MAQEDHAALGCHATKHGSESGDGLTLWAYRAAITGTWSECSSVAW